MKKTLFAFSAAFLMSAMASPVAAAPLNPNDMTVAYYPTGIHAIPLNPVIWLEGADLVNRQGESGNFSQWFANSDLGYHSEWRILKKGNACSGVVISDPYPEWGDYLTPNVDYCVTTNEFAVQ